MVDGLLMDYENMGVFGDIRGLLVGRPMKRTRDFAFPVVTDMDFGHTAPQFTVPIGCRARIDTDSKLFEILASAVA